MLLRITSYNNFAQKKQTTHKTSSDPAPYNNISQRKLQTTNFVKSFWRPSFIHYICKANSCKKLHSNFWRPSFILYSQYNPRSTYKCLRQGIQQQHSRAVYTYFTRKFAPPTTHPPIDKPAKTCYRAGTFI